MQRIAFPHLGIVLSSVPRGFEVGSLYVALYGVMIALAMGGGIALAMWTAKRTGQDPEEYLNFSMVAMVLCVLGARAYYVAFSWDYYREHPLQILNLRGGGLAIYGGVLTGILVVIVFCRIRRLQTWQFLDTAAAGLALGQAIGRWGNFFNREVFGGYTDSLTAMELPLEAVYAGDVTREMREHSRMVDGIEMIRVHPTFLYESLWNLGVMTLLLLVTFKVSRRLAGDVFCLYLIGYGLGRFWIEGIRTDRLLIAGTDLAVSQVLSAVLVLIGIGLLLDRHLGAVGRRR
ncbi:MAG: prolipoprotein diacylglyceryl transferase [Lachnospiraceae bacterium]|nr:prolipoprotein diacylglyceryl transferase [Lachnospiraceae bacterium]